MVRDLFPAGGTSRGRRIYPSSTASGGSIDLRQELYDLLRGAGGDPGQGHWIILRKSKPGTPSEHFEGDQWDEPVGGPQWEYTDTAVICRYRPVTSGSLARFFEQEGEPGLIHVDYRIYYFEHGVKPTKSDFIYEIDWDGDYDTPPVPANLARSAYLDRFNVNDVVPFKGDGGRVEFYACLCRRDIVKH